MPAPAYAISFELAEHSSATAQGDFAVTKVKLDGYVLSASTLGPGSAPARLNVDVGWEFSTDGQWQRLATVAGTRINVGVKDMRKGAGYGWISYACEVDSALVVPKTALADGTTLPARRHIEFNAPIRSTAGLWTPQELGESLLRLSKPVEVAVEPCRLQTDEYCLTHRQYHGHEWKVGDRVFVIDTARSMVTNRVHEVRYYATLARRAKNSWELRAVDIVEGPIDASMKYVEESLLRKAKSVPKFSSVAEAEAWLETHA